MEIDVFYFKGVTVKGAKKMEWNEFLKKRKFECEEEMTGEDGVEGEDSMKGEADMKGEDDMRSYDS